MRIERFDGVAGQTWYAILPDGRETGTHFTKLGARLAGWLLVIKEWW